MNLDDAILYLVEDMRLRDEAQLRRGHRVASLELDGLGYVRHVGGLVASIPDTGRNEQHAGEEPPSRAKEVRLRQREGPALHRALDVHVHLSARVLDPDCREDIERDAGDAVGERPGEDAGSSKGRRAGYRVGRVTIVGHEVPRGNGAPIPRRAQHEGLRDDVFGAVVHAHPPPGLDTDVV